MRGTIVDVQRGPQYLRPKVGWQSYVGDNCPHPVDQGAIQPLSCAILLWCLSDADFVGQAMLRLAKGADEEYEGQVRTRMNQLAGPDWEKKLEATLKAV